VQHEQNHCPRDRSSQSPRHSRRSHWSRSCDRRATLGRPLSAAAADGDPLILGQQNQADTVTVLDGVLGVKPSLEVSNQVPVPNTSPIYAIFASSVNGPGVFGQSHRSFGIPSSGVHGQAIKAAGIGVTAANHEHGTALHVSGKAQFATRSGRATVRAGMAVTDISTCVRKVACRARRSASPISRAIGQGCTSRPSDPTIRSRAKPGST
jgi:hypothetical protein